VPKEQATVLFANEMFYSAFRAGDFATMKTLWSDRHAVGCIHPGWQALSGRDVVLSSWARILEGGGNPVLCHHPQVLLYDDVALVLCYEQLGESVLAASNLFVQEEEGWRLVHHQAGPCAVSLEEIVEPRPAVLQ